MKNQEVSTEHETASVTGQTATPPPTAPVGPLSVEPLQCDHGASIVICHPERGIVATIYPTNADDDPDMDTAAREPWDISYAFLFAASPIMLEALKKCNEAFAAWQSGWQLGQIPGCPEDILPLLHEVQAAIEAATPLADRLIGRWWEPKLSGAAGGGNVAVAAVGGPCVGEPISDEPAS